MSAGWTWVHGDELTSRLTGCNGGCGPVGWEGRVASPEAARYVSWGGLGDESVNDAGEERIDDEGAEVAACTVDVMPEKTENSSRLGPANGSMAVCTALKLSVAFSRCLFTMGYESKGEENVVIDED